MTRNLGLVLLMVAIGLGAGATYLLQHALAPRFATEQRASESQRLLDMLPAGSYDNLPLEQPLAVTDVELESSTLLAGYLATLKGIPRAVVLRSRVTGYEAAIELLIAIDSHGRLIGVKTLEQAETPGLGAVIAAHPNPWLAGFSGKSLNEPNASGWALKKDHGQFDQLAGATVTSRAVINAVHQALRYFDQHQSEWIGSAP